MSTMLDRLRRFRPVGTPGGAGPVGVPEDTHAGVPAELVAVFAGLDAAIAECDVIRSRADQQAADLIATARIEAAGMVSDARARATGERAEVTAAIKARGDTAIDQTLATASAEATHLRQTGAQRMDSLVALVLDRLRADVRGTDG
jgi:vacuolar-type H+-ATPase subunit H